MDCELCHGKRLIPFVKEGRIIASAYQDCPQCQREPSSVTFQRQNYCLCFDVPVNWAYYRTHCREIHGFDPGRDTPEDSPAFIQVDVSDKRLDKFQGELVRLSDTLNKHIKGKQKVNKWQ